MKLRIHENSLRIRVTRPELEALQQDRCVEHCLAVSAHSSLKYRLELIDSGSLSASMTGGSITVYLPLDLAQTWFEESQVAIEGSQPAGDAAQLSILIEKDFQCLVPREGEDQSDYFANPANLRSS